MQSKRFDQAWQILSNTYHAEVIPQTTSYHYRAIGVSDQFETYTLGLRVCVNRAVGAPRYGS